MRPALGALIGLQRFVYSSGSEMAQRLLFGHSNAGALSTLFSGVFDTRVGPKRAPNSYSTIATHIAGVHEGCSYLVAAVGAGIKQIADLRGKRIGISDFASPDKNLYAIILQNHGLDPDSDFQAQVLLYAQELKRAGVLKPSTDPVKYVSRASFDTLA